MSYFENNLLKKFTLKSTTKRQCSTSKTVKSNNYLTSPTNNNDTTSDHFIDTTYEVDILSMDN